MDVRAVEIGPIRLVAYKHIGPYHEIGPHFERISQWAEANNCPLQGAVGVWCAETCGNEPHLLESYAGLIVPEGYEPPEGEGKPEVAHIKGGRYALATHLGPYEGLGDAWKTFINEAIPAAGFELGEGDSFEQYMNDCSEVPPEEVRTDMYMPIR